MNIGIVGHEAAKFTGRTQFLARRLIRKLLSPNDTVVSGRCHLGGIDIWAEEEGSALGCQLLIFPPQTHSWNDGYRPRNLLIAEHSDIVHCIVVATYPDTFRGRRFGYCYHCKTDSHIKSGGCWTALRAKKREWHVIR